jgi:hypothetical protein
VFQWRPGNYLPGRCPELSTAKSPFCPQLLFLENQLVCSGSGKSLFSSVLSVTQELTQPGPCLLTCLHKEPPDPSDLLWSDSGLSYEPRKKRWVGWLPTISGWVAGLQSNKHILADLQWRGMGVREGPQADASPAVMCSQRTVVSSILKFIV